MEIGAIYQGHHQCQFVVWAPFLQSVELHLTFPQERRVPLVKEEQGYWRVILNDVPPGTPYYYVLNHDRERPDPASRLQSENVHGSSVVVDYSLTKKYPNWPGVDLKDYLIYELHVGTFTPEGTFAGVIRQLPYLQQLGITALELMPVAQFPGKRNWGYDGVFPFAVQNSYGGPDGLKQLVHACHARGIAVILDVVYNHLGPEGNYLAEYAPYFSDQYVTPWGRAINFDNRHSDEVRNYFFENALYWFKYFDIDALRLDAIDTIHDEGAIHFLKELKQKVEFLSKTQGRPFYLIAESDLNDPKAVHADCGYGLDAQWCDDFQRSLHTLLTGENRGVYADFGHINHLIKSYREGFVNTGNYSHFRKRRHGISSRTVPTHQLVVFSQNHDMAGNRLNGERLCHLISYSATKLVATAVLFSPYIPLLFMGEEYAEQNHFCYFIDHSDPFLIDCVREGRKREFRESHWSGEPPDPQNEWTFSSSKLNWSLLNEQKHQVLLQFYQTLVQLRKQLPALKTVTREYFNCVQPVDNVLVLTRGDPENTVFYVMNFNRREITLQFPIAGQWHKILDSSEARWLGEGATLPDEISDILQGCIRAETVVVFSRKFPIGE